MVSRGRSVRLDRPLPLHRRSALVGLCTGFALLSIASPAMAEEDQPPPLNAVSSTGGLATATGSSSVTTGDIITGLNTGHAVETGGTSNGDLTVTVAEMMSESNLEVVAEVGPQIADAAGGDGGDASASPAPEPQFNVNISNRDRTNNRSDATAVGEGGEGGEGGAGGDVIIGTPAP
jgi:hypothetical protein